MIQRARFKETSTSSSSQFKIAERNDFLKRLYQRCEGYIELRAIIKNKKPRTTFISLDEDWNDITKLVDRFCNKYKNRNLYFGVATRDGNGGKKKNIINIPCVWADIDFKDIPEKEFNKKLEAFPFPHSIIVYSGGGVHLYWIFKCPVRVKNGEEIERINEWINNELGGDKQAGEYARTMRLPDTINHKYEHEPFCRVIEINPNVYTFEELLEQVPKKKKRVRRKPQPAKQLPLDILEAQIKYITDQIKDTGTVIFNEDNNYADWRNIGFSLADGLGETGRQYFHIISEVDESEYDKKTTDNQYDKCLKSNETRGSKRKFKIGYFIHLAKEHGIRIHKGLRNDRRYTLGGKCIFEPLLEARIFREDGNKKFVVYAKQLLQYHDGYYQNFKDEYYLKLLEAQIEYVHDGRAHKAKEILEVLKHQHYEMKEIEVNANPKLINVKNGILDIDTKKLQPHTPNMVFNYQIPVEYNPKAKCPKFRKFLRQVLVKEESLKPDKELIKIVRRFIGYCLYSRIPYHESLMFLGEGSNGKGTLCRVITALLGEDLTSFVDFDKISNNSFASSHLVGKLLNISSDFNANKVGEGDVKAIIAGDSIFVERKNERGFDYAPTAKHITCLNNLPLSMDTSYGFFRRFKIIPFHRKFIPKVEMESIEEEEKEVCKLRDAHIENKLKTKEELEGILVWAVKGLRLLLKDDEFPYSEQVAKYKNMFKVRCSTVENFFDEMVDRSEDVFDQEETFQKVYKTYITYCNINKVPSLSSRKFSEKINNMGCETGRKTDNVKFIIGVKLRKWD